VKLCEQTDHKHSPACKFEVILYLAYLKISSRIDDQPRSSENCFSSKAKVKLSLCLAKHQTMKTYWGVEVKPHAFFDLGTGWR